MSSKDSYIVSARKYRPATFRSVVGQKALTTTLKNAISGGKLAQAYLFCGPRGIGKTSCARIFAKTINCLHPTPDGEACGECESCKAIEKGSSFNLVELDAASNNSVDDIRNITDQVNIPAQDGRYRVFIIDEVHMLSNSAFNAFLKTLEEPPKNVVFILATTERHKVIPTILSRCQIYDFRRITVNDIIDHLAYVANSEGVEADKEALSVIALKADGAMRDALSIFDQVVASCHGSISYQGAIEALNVLDQEYYFKMVDIFKAGDVGSALVTFKEITDKGFDSQFFINGLAEHVRNLMVCMDPRTISLLETSQEWAEKYKHQAPSLPIEWYYNAIKILNDTDYNYRLSGNKRLLVELALIRLCRLLVHESRSKILKASQENGGNSVPFVKPDGSKPQAVPEHKNEAMVSTYSGTSEKSTLNVSEESVNNQKPVQSYKTSEDVKPKNRQEIPDRPRSFRLNNELTSKTVYSDNTPKKTPFTPDEFISLWKDYAESHKEQRILVAAMRAGIPEKITDVDYTIKVEHPAQKQAFEASLNELIGFLRQRLNNDYVTLTVEISEKGSDEIRMSPKEFLKFSVEKNPGLADLLKSINAELM